MATIYTRKGEAILCDDDMADELQRHIWHTVRGYACTNIKRDRVKTKIFMHRIVVGFPVGMMIDHKSGDTLDNQRSNLRVCTGSQNQGNRHAALRNRFAFKGVRAGGCDSSFAAQIRINGQRRYLGSFRSIEAAARAYDAAAIQHFGEFARPNFPQEAAQ